MEVAAEKRAAPNGFGVFPERNVLNRKGSSDTAKSSTVFKTDVLLVSMGSADVTLVYLIHTEIRMMKLNAKLSRSL